MKKYSFRTLEGIYLVQLPNYRYEYRKTFNGRKEYRRVNSYLIYNASNKTSKLINYEEARTSLFDKELNMFVVKENERFLVAEDGMCFYMDIDGNTTPYNGDVYSMRKHEINIIPSTDLITQQESLPINWDDFESIVSFDFNGNKIKLPNGKTTELPYDIRKEFNGLYLIVKEIKNEKGEWDGCVFGICNKEGYIIVEPKYEAIFTDGFSANINFYQVALNGKYGIINKEGIEVLPPVYGWINDCDGVVAIVDDGSRLIDISSRKVLSISNNELSFIKDGWIRVSNKGILKTDGTYFPISIKTKVNGCGSNNSRNYDAIGDKVCDGLLPVYDSKRGYGYVNLDSNELINCKYNEIHYFVEGRAKVRYDSFFGVIDKNGNNIVKNGSQEISVPRNYDWACDFEDGISIVQEKGLYGCIDSNMNVIFPCVFHSFEDVKRAYKKVLIINRKDDCHDDLLDLETPVPFKSDGLYGFKRIDGKILCPPLFRVANKFKEGRSLVYYGDKFGYLNENLEFAIPPIYSLGEDFSEGLALVNLRDYINKDGVCVIHTDHHIENLKSFCGGIVHCEYNYCQPRRDNDDYVLTKRICGF